MREENELSLLTVTMLSELLTVNKTFESEIPPHGVDRKMTALCFNSHLCSAQFFIQSLQAARRGEILKELPETEF